jgi:thiol-disulfide isomerase/thioredoxin
MSTASRSRTGRMIRALHVRRASLPRVLAALSLAFSTVAPAADTLVPWTGGATPPLAVKDIDGREWRLDHLGGRTVLVNFWATWCAPCVQEMPSLQRLRDRFAARGFEVIGINLEENAARIRPFLDRYAVSFPVVRDHDGSVRSRWDVRVYPSSFVVGPDGRIAFAAVGELNWDDPAVIARVQSVIGR